MEKKAKGALSHPKIFLLVLLVVFVLALTLKVCASLRIYEVTGLSMAPTLQEGDRVLFQAETSFQCGDVVILPFSDLGMVIKRVIATEGQHVVVDYAANQVTVDGVVLDEPYATEPMGDTRNPSMTLLDVTVPPGRVYVLGDGRNHSVDSRHEQLGCVPVSAVWGKALLRFSPRFGLLG